MGDIFPVILRIRVFCNKHIGNVGPASPTLYMACVKTSMPPSLQTDVSLQARAHFSTKLPAAQLSKHTLASLLQHTRPKALPSLGKHPPPSAPGFKAESKCSQDSSPIL